MSKYKAGDKVVMEIISADQDEIKKYSVSGVNNNWRWCLPQDLLERYIEPLSTYTEPLEAKIRRQAAEITRLLEENEKLKKENETLSVKVDYYESYSDKHEEECKQEFNRGCNEAWELARKGMLMSSTDREAIFGSGYNAMYGVLMYHTYQEAAAKVEAWEKAKEEIKVRDVFEFASGGEAVVMKVYEDGEVTLVFPDGGCGIYKPHESWHKTGRHIDIDSLLKQIGEE